MASIILSDNAPKDQQIHFSFAGVEFDLGGSVANYETDDRDVISNASSHPWLKIAPAAKAAPAPTPPAAPVAPEATDPTETN